MLLVTSAEGCVLQSEVSPNLFFFQQRLGLITTYWLIGKEGFERPPTRHPRRRYLSPSSRLYTSIMRANITVKSNGLFYFLLGVL